MVSADPQFPPKQKKSQAKHGDRLVQGIPPVICPLQQRTPVPAESKRVPDAESPGIGVPWFVLLPLHPQYLAFYQKLCFCRSLEEG